MERQDRSAVHLGRRGTSRGRQDSARSITPLPGLHDCTILANVCSRARRLFQVDTGGLRTAQSSYYRTFVLEAKHGFNKTTHVTFLADLIKGYALGAIFLLPILAGVLEIVDRTGEAFVQWVCLFVCVARL